MLPQIHVREDGIWCGNRKIAEVSFTFNVPEERARIQALFDQMALVVDFGRHSTSGF